MSYDAYETSQQDGAPVELYVFRLGLRTLYYTSADEDYPYDNETYVAEPIKRSRLDFTEELNRQNVQLEVMRSNAIAEYFRFSPPDTVVSVTLLRIHREDPDQDAVVAWIGRVLSVRWKMLTANLYCEPVSTSQRRAGLKRNYQKNCPHTLYHGGCKANRTDHRYQGTVSAVDANNVTVSGTTGGSYGGGYLSWIDSDGIVNSRTIESHSGDVLTLLTSSFGLAPGQDVEVYPGCDHTLDGDCSQRFGQEANYGGTTIFQPDFNPFESKVF